MKIWRKIKKYYFKIYHFFKLIGIFLIIFFPSIVKADTIDNYNKIEYIKGTGTQWIDTGYVATTGMKAEYEVIYGSDIQTINGGYIVGSHNTSSPYSRNGGYYNNNLGVKGWELGYGNFFPKSSATIEYNKKYKVEFSTFVGNAYLTVDNVRLIYRTDTTAMSCNTNVMLFTNAMTNREGGSKTIAKVFYVKIWDINNNLIRDFIPVKRKSDNVIGMYDLENNVFYTNVGTGNFEGGDIIPDPGPGPDPTPSGNEVYDDFLTIYVDRFNYLGNGLLENPYLFVFAGIIFSFVVLEIFLHMLHIRGGYKK